MQWKRIQTGGYCSLLGAELDKTNGIAVVASLLSLYFYDLIPKSKKALFSHLEIVKDLERKKD